MSGHAPLSASGALCDVASERVSCRRTGLCGVTSPGKKGCGCERWCVPAAPPPRGPASGGAGWEESPAGTRCSPSGRGSGGSSEGGAADAGGVLGCPFSELRCSDGLQRCDSLPRPGNPLPVAGKSCAGGAEVYCRRTPGNRG